MGKILVIQGADFSTNKVDTVKIRPKDWIDYEIYISSVEEIENPEYKIVYLDSDDKIIYGVNVDNVITDNLSVVSNDISKAIIYLENNNQPQKNLINS